MMKLSPMIGKRSNSTSGWEKPGSMKNPEWQKILDETGLTDKLKEFSDLQLEGADVFHSTFSNLKSYPFSMKWATGSCPSIPVTAVSGSSLPTKWKGGHSSLKLCRVQQ